MHTWLKRVVLGVPANAGYFQLPESIGTRKSGGFDAMLDDILAEERRELTVREKYDPQLARERKPGAASKARPPSRPYPRRYASEIAKNKRKKRRT